MADQAAVKKILSMVDLCGSKEKKASFVEIIKRSLPKHIQNKDRYVMIFEEVVKAKLADPYVTDKKSILPCVFQAVKFGLDCDPAQGLIYFIPYKGKLTYQLGYKGLIQLARNSGQVKDVRAGLVYKNDEWDYYEDERGQHFKYKPTWSEEKGHEICGFSIVTMSDGSCFIHPMETSRIDKIKKMVLQRTPKSPWADSLGEPEMRKKTVIRRHCKTLPMSTEMAQAVEQEEQVERGEIPKYTADEIEGVLDKLDIPNEEPQDNADDLKNDEFVKQLDAAEAANK